MSIWRKKEITQKKDILKNINSETNLYLDYDYITQESIDKFWSSVDKREYDECWEWKGDKKIYYNGKFLKVHRLAYIIAYGNIPKGLNVSHDCNNSRCVNPNHLSASKKKGSKWNESRIPRKEWLEMMGYDSLKEYINDVLDEIKN